MKKIVSITLAAVLGVLAVVTIILSLVKVNFNPCINYNIGTITVYKNGGQHAGYSEDQEVYKQIVGKLEKGLSENIIASLFQGGFSAKAKAEVEERSTTLESDLTNSEKIHLVLDYNTVQTLTVKGKEFVSESTNKVVKYKRLIVEITNSKNLAATNIYVVDYRENGTNNSNYSSQRVKTVSHFSNLYEYLTELTAPGV